VSRVVNDTRAIAPEFDERDVQNSECGAQLRKHGRAANRERLAFEVSIPQPDDKMTAGNRRAPAA
jgi:hypothetical protein